MKDKPMWITDQLPDSDMTVLMRLSDNEYPVWPGFHDGEGWNACDGSTVEGPVLGWMELETAAKLLDQQSKRNLEMGTRVTRPSGYQPSTLNYQPTKDVANDSDWK